MEYGNHIDTDDFTRCPQCHGPVEDLRDSGFNAEVLDKEKICYIWNKHMFTCNNKSRRCITDEIGYPVDPKIRNFLIKEMEKYIQSIPEFRRNNAKELEEILQGSGLVK
ncbi:MAG TPA: hypothetical protein VHD33_06210 [Legionellaceae bacterium]|nr:hypothetical protein [Legionellaceae bacterium]